MAVGDGGVRVAEGSDRGGGAAEIGRALSVVGDGGWGRLVAAGRGEDERFADELVTASASLDPRAVAARAGARVGDVRAVDVAPRPGAGLRGAARRRARAAVPRGGAQGRGEPTAGHDAEQRPAGAQRVGRVRGRSATCPTARCCSSTISPTRSGRSPWSRAPCRQAGSGPVHPFVLATAIAG